MHAAFTLGLRCTLCALAKHRRPIQTKKCSAFHSTLGIAFSSTTFRRRDPPYRSTSTGSDGVRRTRASHGLNDSFSSRNGSWITGRYLNDRNRRFRQLRHPCVVLVDKMPCAIHLVHEHVNTSAAQSVAEVVNVQERFALT